MLLFQVMEALESVSSVALTLRDEEEAWILTDLQSSKGERIGFMYAAWNPSIGGNVIKIGATMRSSPFPRLKELSRNLLTSFQLIACVQTTTPFALEKRAHEHFKQYRIGHQDTGRSTEFFMVSKEQVEEYFAAVARNEI